LANSAVASAANAICEASALLAHTSKNLPFIRFPKIYPSMASMLRQKHGCCAQSAQRKQIDARKFSLYAAAKESSCR